MGNPLSALQRGLTNLLSRAVVTGLNSASKCQLLQIAMIANESKRDIEHLEPYGFTSAAHLGAEAVALFQEGDRSHGVVIVVADRRYRLTGLEHGEVALYSDEGDSVVLRRGRVVEVTTSQLVINASEQVAINTAQMAINASEQIALNAPLVAVSGAVLAQQGVTSMSDIADKSGSLSTVRQQFNTHTHPDVHGSQTGTPNQPMESVI